MLDDKDIKKLTAVLATKKEMDAFAVMVQKGFDETAKKADMDLKFDGIETRLSRVEKDVGIIKETMKNMVAENYKRRIEKLEDELKEIKGTLAMILK
jgi:hypothetical protein